MLRILDYIFLMRPTILVPVWIFLLLGYYRGTGDKFIVSRPFIIGFILYTLLMASTYIVNQIADIETDRINKKLYLLPEGYISVKNAWIQTIVLVALAFPLSINFPFLYKLFLLLSLILGLLYSISPFKLKGRPFLDLTSNAIGFGFLNFSIGWMTGAKFSSQCVIYSIPYILSVGAVFINTTILDISGDKKTGEITTGVFLGREKSLFLSTFLMGLAAVISFILRDFVCFPCAIVSFFLFLSAYLKKDIKSVFYSIRIGAPLLAIAVGILYPWFFALLIFGFVLTRFYYKKRFNIIYPTVT